MSIIIPRPPSEAGYMLEREDPIRRPMGEMPVTVARPPKKPKQTPQEAVDEFWSKFTTQTPGKATTVIPSNEYAKRVARRSRTAVGTTAQASYEEAAAVCRAKVSKIVKECRRVNQKYRDPHFDLEVDLKLNGRDTLESLCNTKEKEDPGFRPKSAKRVVDIFDAPRFYIDGPTANDVRQGRDGDCWLLAALCTLSNKPSLIERVCVARNEQVGVYGFVFHRDGEWISEIIDDKLYLTKPDFDESFLERILWEDRERVNSEEQYRKTYQSGSGALYFAQCEHDNETWLPLLEKAYAKAHGDYQAIEGGFTGEGIEDLTGGVTTELYTTDILDKEYFWKEELMKVNDEFLFGCATGVWGVGWGERKGIVENHAYSVMRAVEMDGHRLVLLKNPWGRGEWKGAWSDGSKEWTAEWLIKLNHRFGDDGKFWISYEDLLRKYQAFDRTRLFGPEWKITSVWATISVPWRLDYHDRYFEFSLAKTGPVVLVLSQLDDRYYRGLEGQYRFVLNFRLHKKGQQDYLVRSTAPYGQTRSVNVELELEAGKYTVLMKVNATRHLDILPIEEVIRNNARDRRDKLVAVGIYDLAHSKGRMVETEEEKEAKRAAGKRKKDKEREELRKTIMETRRYRHYLEVKYHNRRKKRHEEATARRRAKRAAKVEKERTLDLNREHQEEPKAGNQKRVQVLSPADTPEPSSKSANNSKTESHSDETGNPGKSHESTSPKPEAKGSDEPSNGAKQDAPSNPDKPSPGGPDMPVRTAERDVSPASRVGIQHGIPRQEQEEGRSDTETGISSPSEISNTELDFELRRRANQPSPPPPVRVVPNAAVQEEEDEFESSPWNAVATVGLRVYYKVKEEDKDKEIVKLRVVRPNPYAKTGDDESDDSDADDEEDGNEVGDGEKDKLNEDEDKKKSSMGLDVDDSAKDATLEGNQEQRKKSILSLVPH